MLKDLIDGEITQDDFMRNYDVTLLKQKLPKHIHGLCFKEDRIFVIINSRLGDENSKKTLLHEFAHVELHHLDKMFYYHSVENMEDEADRYIDFLLGDD